ncbi:MAG TPA: 2Fe-2S iron-sulfur cluster-binding protein [Xanthobacteraceae bacterium]|nr:2Fe-2S iron-sulfur cluster-binding protein [Xanthobacteraceae bacterium]
MPKVTFLLVDGSTETIDAEPNISLMRAALTNGVAGIEAECGGAMACGTCHVHIDGGGSRLPPPCIEESEMLDMLSGPRTPASRLSCQLVLGSEHEGLMVRVPATQG